MYLNGLRRKEIKMIRKWYEVSCDLCGHVINHYVGLKPTPTDLRRYGIKVRINNGKTIVYCDGCFKKI